MAINIQSKHFFVFLYCFFSTFFLVGSDDKYNQIIQSQLKNQKEISELVKQLNPTYVEFFLKTTKKYAVYGTVTGLCGLGVFILLVKYHGLPTPKNLEESKKEIIDKIEESSKEKIQKLKQNEKGIAKNTQSFEKKLDQITKITTSWIQQKHTECQALLLQSSTIKKSLSEILKNTHKQNEYITSIDKQMLETKDLSSKTLAVSKQSKDLSSKTLAVSKQSKDLSSKTLAVSEESKDLSSKTLAVSKQSKDLSSKALVSSQKRINELSQLIKEVETMKREFSNYGEQPPAGMSKDGSGEGCAIDEYYLN